MIKKIIKNFNLLNLLLSFAAFMLLNNVLFLNSSVETGRPTIVKKTAEPEGDEGRKTAEMSIQEYAVVSEQNVFYPGRKAPVEVKEQQKDEKAAPKPEFILYGTLVDEDLRLAYMEDKKAPVTSPGRGNKQLTLRLGDTLSGYTVREIGQDTVVMVKGDDRITVNIKAGKNSAKEGQLPALPAPAQPQQPTVKPAMPANPPQPVQVQPAAPVVPAQPAQNFPPRQPGRKMVPESPFPQNRPTR